ncbi:MAG: TlpA family protein disulfide reductase [Chloroflexi bacterium]|nr:TlpA family protein disulfide reductase [Chloroflexota bacterium]
MHRWTWLIALVALLLGCSSFKRPEPATPTPVPPSPTPTITVPPLPTRTPTPRPTATDQAPDVPVGPHRGMRAPDWTLPTLDGGTLSLADLRGKPVVLNFWATWCPPCVEELPMIARYAQQYQDQFHVVLINVDESPGHVKTFLEDLGLDPLPPVVLDAKAEVALRYRVNGLPTTFFLDDQGIIRYIRIGGMYEGDFRTGLKAIGVSLTP